MKIAMIMHPWDAVVPAGEQTNSIVILAYEIARRLARFHEVVIYARQGQHQPCQEIDSHKVRMHRIPGIAKKSYQLLERFVASIAPASPFFVSPLYFFPYIQQVARDLQRQQFDIIHLFTFSQFVPPIRALNPGAKIVLHMGDNTLLQRDPDIAKAQLGQVDLIVGCSQHVVENIRHRFPQLSAECRVLHNGVDTSRFVGYTNNDTTQNHRGKRVLFVGRVSPEKGLHILMEAFCEVIKSVPDCQLDVIGKPGLLPYSPHIALSNDEKLTDLRRFYGHTKLQMLYRQIVDRGASYLAYLCNLVPPNAVDRIVFHGLVANKDLVDYYQRADIFVFPSVINEAFGIPVVEAMACGLPVVATRSGGIPETIVNGETGMLVERGDAPALAQAMLRLLEDNALRTSMGERGRLRAVASFSWDRLVDTLSGYYEDLCTAAPCNTSDRQAVG